MLLMCRFYHATPEFCFTTQGVVWGTPASGWMLSDGLQAPSRALQRWKRQCHQRFLQIFTGFDHVPQMACSQTSTPGIGKRVAGLAAERQQERMRQGDDPLLLVFAFRPHDKLDVHGVGVTNRDAGLEPAELHFPDATKRVGTGLEAADVF